MKARGTPKTKCVICTVTGVSEKGASCELNIGYPALMEELDGEDPGRESKPRQEA